MKAIDTSNYAVALQAGSARRPCDTAVCWRSSSRAQIFRGAGAPSIAFAQHVLPRGTIVTSVYCLR